MTDGSNLGITSDRALNAILGGEEEPTEEESQTPEQVRERIAAATADTYSGGTDCLTRAVLRLFEQKPIAKSWPTGADYGWVLQDGTKWTNDQAREAGVWKRFGGSANWTDPETSATWKKTSTVDLWTEARAIATEQEEAAFEDSTGFMWGFAVNQARWIAGAVIGENPALITIEPVVPSTRGRE